MYMQAYLYAWITWMTLTVGCTGLLLLHHAVRGKWSLVVLRVLETGARMLPLMFFAGIPFVVTVLGGSDTIFPWVTMHNDKIVQSKSAYLNSTGFAVRYVAYFVLWILLSSALNRSSLRQDQNRNENEAQFRANWGAFGLVLFILSVTFAYTDWVMSLDPHWYSTIFPAWFLVGGALMALSFAAIYATRRIHTQPWDKVVDFGFTKDIGNLLLAFTLIWAYFSLSQLLIMWSGNIPEEVVYYQKRFSNPTLNAMGVLLIGLQWMVPFLALMAPRTKKQPKLLCTVAMLILVMRFVDIYWTVVPFFVKGDHGVDTSMALTSVGLMAAFGIVWLGAFYGTIKKRSPIPTHDPRLEEALSHV